MGESKVEEKEKAIASVPGYKILTYRTAKGSFTLPKRMNFRKGSKRPLTPPPAHFRKVMLQFFSEIHDRSIVFNGKNLQHKFLD